ncbi:nucleoside triphosphate pyrophosphohydrolase [Catellatospora citrea]|uniref:nucleoside triphosphate pyrophosphohydrolase n=1 Tax=Catellatospora citrea TaxID=53366 RepID=UPI0033FD597E
MAKSRKIPYGKLVRDRIPEIISAGGQIPEIQVLGPDDFLAALIAKLHEEAEELGSAEVDEVLGELADVHEVLAALTIALGHTDEEVKAAAASKRSERGGFDERLWLDEVRVPQSG